MTVLNYVFNYFKITCIHYLEHSSGNVWLKIMSKEAAASSDVGNRQILRFLTG